MGKALDLLFLKPVHALLLIPLALFLWEFLAYSSQADDAYISYRYAQNFVNGYGLVFNLGERVEGYTNLLWTLLVAVEIKLGLTAPEAGHILGVLFGALCLIGVYFFTLGILPCKRKAFAILAPFALLSSNSFASWTASGLETPMFVAWVTFAFVFFLSGHIWLLVTCCVLSILTRPEGVLLAFVLITADWLRNIYTSRPATLVSLVRLLVPGLIILSVVLVHTAVRLIYYDDWLPNTFRAKVGGIPVSRGFEYIYFFLADGPGFLIAGALFAAVTIPLYRIPFIFIALVFFYVVSIGGDVFQFGRFLVPILPLLVGGAIAAIFVAVERKNFTCAALLVCMFSIYPFWSLYSYWPVTNDNAGAQRMPFPMPGKRSAALANHLYGGDDSYVKSRAGRILSLNPPVRLVAAVGLGRMGYFLGDIPILDLVGLVDRHIARSDKIIQGNVLILPGHQRTDANYVFARDPDLILIPRKEDGWIALPATQDLWSDPRFDQRYAWDFDLQAYRRRIKTSNQ